MPLQRLWGSCLATARGENAGADTGLFRQLLLEDYVKTGVAPLEATASRQSSVPLSQGHSSAALPHDAVLNRIKPLLQQDVKRLDDQRYLQALADCEERRHQKRSPMSVLSDGGFRGANEIVSLPSLCPHV